MSIKIDKFNKDQERKEVPDIRSGDTVRVHQKVKEGGKERIQDFEGLVIAKKHGKGISATITVRRILQGIGVERIFPIHSPVIAKIEIIKKGKARRAKLYYLRTAKGKRAKLKKEEFSQAIADQQKEPDKSPEGHFDGPATISPGASLGGEEPIKEETEAGAPEETK